jgi:hypothetical protein
MTEVHVAVGSYVVDALEPAERAEFETHLTGCERCQHEVAEYTEVVAELAKLTAEPAPAELRGSILSAISEVPQMIPDTVVRLHKHGSLAATSAPGGGTSTLPGGGDDAHPVVTHEVAPLEEHPSVVPDWSWSVPLDDEQVEVKARRDRRSRRILSAVAAAAVLVALFLGGQVYSLTQRNQEQEAVRQAQVAATQAETEVLTASDSLVYKATVDGAAVRYVVSKDRNQGLFLATNLPDPGPNAVYQLWTLKNGIPTSAGLLPKGGTVRQLFALGEADIVAVTREPSPAGSASPTRPTLSDTTL